ncbi:MAG: hypothetical protein J0L84_04710, partial [Verrucomicrobia bacterium]|nr:hypothetical protein [Verrucomicrobiota bacterium]
RPLRVPVLPSNDAPASAQPLEGTNGSVAVQLGGSTLESWEPSGDPSVPQGSVWFHWRAPATGQAWFRSAFPPQGTNDVRLYSQSASQRLQEVAAWKDRDGVGLLVERAAEYWIRVAGDTRVHSSSLDWESWPFRVVVPGPGIVLASRVSFELMADVPPDDISEVLYLHWGSMSGPGRSPPWKVTPEHLAAGGMGAVGAQIGFRNGTVMQIPESAFVRWRPDNDDLARAIPWREHSVSWVSTAGATLEAGEPAAPSGSRTLWWSFVAPDDGFVRMASGDAAHPMEAFRVPQTDSWNGAVRVAGPAGSGDLEVRRGQKFLFRLVASAITQVSVDLHFSRVGANPSPESAAILPDDGGPLRAEFGPSGTSGSSRFWWIEPGRSGVMFFEQSDPYPGDFRWNLYPDGILTGEHPFQWPDHHPVQQGRRYLVECWLSDGHFGTWTGRAVIQEANTNDHLSRRWEVPPTGLQRRFFLGDTPSDPAEPVINLTAGPSALRSLWFSWTSPRRQYATFWSSPVAPLGVFEGDSLNELWMMARSNGEPITFLAEPGRTYSMLLQQAGLQEYGITVGVGPVPAPRGDDFAGRGRVHGFDAVLEFECQAATREPGEPRHGGGLAAASSWWSWTAPARGTLSLGRDTGVYNPFDLTVYRGTELARLTPVTGTEGNPDIRMLELPVEAGEELQFAGVSRQGPFWPFHRPERWLLRFKSGFDPETDLQVTPLADGLEVRWPEALDGFLLETTTDPVRRDWQAVDRRAGPSVRLAAPATGAVYFRMRAP